MIHIVGWGMTTKRRDKIIAVDFDGTICELNGSVTAKKKPNIQMIDFLKEMQTSGHRLILLTLREGLRLQEAIDYCKYYGIVFDAVNENVPDMDEILGHPRKIFADLYIDDQNAQGSIFANLPFRG